MKFNKTLPAKMSNEEMQDKVREAVNFADEKSWEKAEKAIWDVSKSILRFWPPSNEERETIALLKPEVVKVLKALADVGINDISDAYLAFGIAGKDRQMINSCYLAFQHRTEYNLRTDVLD